MFPAASWWAACGIEVGREERLSLEFAFGFPEIRANSVLMGMALCVVIPKLLFANI